MTIARKILFAAIMMSLAAIEINAQNAVAVSSNPGPGLHVALNWAPFPGATRYNIFRRNDAVATYPGTPINATPIAVMTNCNTIKSTLINGLDSSDWKTVQKALAGPPPAGAGLFNPCNINTLTAGSEKHKRLAAISRTSIPISLAAGLGYRDATVVNGTAYRYRIVALNSSNVVVGTVADNILVTAGTVVLLAPPTGVVAEAGDDKVLVRWDDVAGAAGFILERGNTNIGPFQRVNETHFAAEVKNHINGDTIIPSTNGMMDYKRYTSLHGKDSTHVVFGIPIPGPKNNSSYYYRVSSLDLFMRGGSPSGVVGPAIPRDSTDPAVPMDITATPDDVSGHVNIKWSQVTKDINSHWEYPDSSVHYRLYRFTSTDNPNTAASVYLGDVPTIPGPKSRDFNDTDPSLRSAFGDKTWWYRIRSIDQATNLSSWSSAVSAIVKDITAPGIVKNLVTSGFEDHIKVKWQQNTEPDMASYMVYRSLCHLGSWIDCAKTKECREWQTYDPDKGQGEPVNPNNPIGVTTHVPTGATTAPKPLIPCPCSGPFVFLGEITKDSVARAISRGNFFFEDRTIPAGSPLCYAYWVKAKDSSGNQSGSFPIPSPAEVAQIKCERLRDKTPPEQAIIAGLFAQAEQIRVEWIGPPTQDTRAYHVYRAKGTNPAVEPPVSDYSWVGGMTVELPPALPVVLAAPYTPPGIATCDKISVQSTPWMSAGHFDDKSVDPKLTYWYKVVGIDYDGNETPLNRAAAISTFSFSRKAPDAPTITTIDKTGDPCTVTVNWTPSYNASSQVGFIVYRGNASGGPFTPIVVSPIKGNSFTDVNVVKGHTYWYSVAVLMQNGRISAMSAAKSVTP